MEEEEGKKKWEDKGGQVAAIKRAALRCHHQRLNKPASSNCEVFTVNQGEIEAGSRGRGCASGSQANWTSRCLVWPRAFFALCLQPPAEALIVLFCLMLKLDFCSSVAECPFTCKYFTTVIKHFFKHSEFVPGHLV